MELARPLAAEQPAQTSPLTTLRLQRKLTIEEAAKRAALWPEQVEWLEEGKLYRFQRHDTAVGRAGHELSCRHAISCRLVQRRHAISCWFVRLC